MRRDVVFVGAGPAATLAAALILRREPGRRVLLLEASELPRAHVGEAVLPSWERILRQAGVVERVDAATPIKKLGISFAWGPVASGETWTADFREENGRAPPASWHVRRDAFDALLVEHARELGAEVRTGACVESVRAIVGGQALAGAPDDHDAVEGLEIEWRERGETRRVESAWVVDASGQQRLLARLWKIGLHRHAEMNNFAVYGYWAGSDIHQVEAWRAEPDERWALVATSDLGWVWHIPIERDLVSVGLVTHRDTLRAQRDQDLERTYRDGIASSRVAALLENARFVGGVPDGSAATPSVISDWSYRSERICGPGWFMAGDAAMFVDPILSSGLVLASQAALMVANALRTTWSDAAVSAERLRRSYARRYESLGGTYHRMARAWYRRNARSAAWHWEAHRERLRAGGEAIYERSADALTAISMGTVVDPLETVARRNEPALVGWFGWSTARRLFASEARDADHAWRRTGDAAAARDRARREIHERWSRLARARLALRAGAPRVVDGYTTHDLADRWEPLRYVELDLPSEGGRPAVDERAPLAFPELGGRTSRLLAAMDGTREGASLLREAMDGLHAGTEERDATLVALLELLLQLDMLGLVDAVAPEAEVPLTGHPLVAVLIDVLLRSAAPGASIGVELDPIGASARVEVTTPEGSAIYRLVDARACRRESFAHFSATTACAPIAERPREADPFLVAVVRRLDAHGSPHAASLWDACARLPGLRVRATRTPTGAVLSRDDAPPSG